LLVALLPLAGGGTSATASEARAPAPRQCIRLPGPVARATVTGTLTLGIFPGPPNYENVAAGDSKEEAFILSLRQPLCLDDGGEFADPRYLFSTVQVGANEDALLGVLRAALGRPVTVSGEAFPAHTGHHHAPLVVLADTVTVR